VNKPLDELYLIWLYSQVADANATSPSRTYWKLFNQLYTKEFQSFVGNDENRMEDGKALRLEFVREQNIFDVPTAWMELECSFLELMVGLSRRLAFEAGGEPYYWFWEMVENLELEHYTDARRLQRVKINRVLDRVIHREYDRDGVGGFFPLRHPRKDQRKEELWYQMNQYVLELS